ncbi:MAG: ferrous iron transport protein B [Asgard group archaeon]|nr:ferrous iron transport protein B [Asgard group archaeon]
MNKIALVGNPNVGKSVIFNALTGLNQTIANFPGCTVEKKEGKLTYLDEKIEIIDLPGIYSLSPHSIDEKIARNYLLENRPDLVVAILDASNLERNLYLTIQLMELQIPFIVVLNMIDLARGKGITLNTEILEKNLGVPVLTTIATQGKGLPELRDAICKYSKNPPEYSPLIWPKEIEKVIQEISEKIISYNPDLGETYPLKRLVTSLLEDDEKAWRIVKEAGIPKQELEFLINDIQENKFNGETILTLVDARYEIVNRFIKNVQKRFSDHRWVFTDMLDEVLTNKFLGIPIFLAIMWGVFQLTFTVGAPLVSLIEVIFNYLGDGVYYLTDLLDGAGTGHNPISDFIVGAIINGVGSVVSFLPNIVILFIAIAILEDSGYLSRVAFLMDKIFSRIGLQGQSIIPMLIGFGCNVPAVMVTRSIKNENDRFTTIMVNGFMSCSARLPVYVLIAGTIFPAFAGAVTLGLYVLGIIVAIFAAFVLRKTVFRGERSDLIIELQPYTVPAPQTVFIKMWNRVKMFLKKASTIIFAAVTIIYLLNEANIIGYFGKGLSYLFWWMKTTDGTRIGWEYTAALLIGIVAKEVVVGTLGTLLGFSSATPTNPVVQETIGSLGPAAGLSYLVFILLYVPCIATLAVIKKETNSWKWMLFNLLMSTGIAYALSAATYFLVKAFMLIPW